MTYESNNSQDAIFEELDLTEEDLYIIQVKENEFLSQSNSTSFLLSNPQTSFHSSLFQPALAPPSSSSTYMQSNNSVAWQWRDTSLANLNAQINRLKQENEHLIRQLQTVRQEQLSRCGEIAILRQKYSSLERHSIETKTLLSQRSEELLSRESAVARSKEEEICRLRDELEFKEQELFAAQTNLRAFLRREKDLSKNSSSNLPLPINENSQPPFKKIASTQPKSPVKTKYEIVESLHTEVPFSKILFLRDRVLDIMEENSLTPNTELCRLLNYLADDKKPIRFDELSSFFKAHYPQLYRDSLQTLFKFYYDFDIEQDGITAKLKKICKTVDNGVLEDLENFFNSSESITSLETLNQDPTNLDGCLFFALLFWNFSLHRPDNTYLFVCQLDFVHFERFIKVLLQCPLELMTKIVLSLIYQCKVEIDRFGMFAHEIVFLLTRNENNCHFSDNVKELLDAINQYICSI